MGLIGKVLDKVFPKKIDKETLSPEVKKDLELLEVEEEKVVKEMEENRYDHRRIMSLIPKVIHLMNKRDKLVGLSVKQKFRRKQLKSLHVAFKRKIKKWGAE